MGLFRSAIVRKPRSEESERKYQFGDEEVVLGNQVLQGVSSELPCSTLIIWR